MNLKKTTSSHSKDDELRAVCDLRTLDMPQRQQQAINQRINFSLGHPLPVIHRVLFT